MWRNTFSWLMVGCWASSTERIAPTERIAHSAGTIHCPIVGTWSSWISELSLQKTPHDEDAGELLHLFRTLLVLFQETIPFFSQENK
jgi:hypothetical protein